MIQDSRPVAKKGGQEQKGIQIQELQFKMTIAISWFFLLPFLLVIMLFPLASNTSNSLTISSSLPTSFQIDIEHISYRSNLTKMQIIQRSISHRNSRLAQLAKRTTERTTNPDFQSMLRHSEGEITLNLSLGTPPRRFSAIMDTGSELIWTQCMPCKNCYAQPTPIFNPSTSSSFSNLPCQSSLCASRMRRCEANRCTYMATYGDNSYTQGYLAMDTFTLGDTMQNVSIPNIGFGCGDDNWGTGLDIVAGILGLGRGPLSLVSQLKAQKFSYCLPSEREGKRGILSFGSLADKNCNASNSKGTPLLKNKALPSCYFITLEGISLDDTRLNISKSIFELKQDQTGGMILDSGTSITYLVAEAYWILRREFAARTKLPFVSSPFTELDLCFRTPVGKNVSSIPFPKLKFHFTNVDLELPKENFLIDDTSTRLVCLGIMPSNGLSIFGSMQQQNYWVLHNLEKQTVSFLPARACSLMC